jgi:diamine N-acetyltransferase
LSQITTIASLAEQIWREYYPAIIGPRQVDYMLEKFQSASAIAKQIQAEDLRYYLLQADGNAIGYLAVQPRDDSLFLSKLYVLAAERGKGHARRAVDVVATLAAALGMRKLSLTVNRHNALALAVYTSLGFIRVGSVRTDIGGGFVMDDYRLEKAL